MSLSLGLKLRFVSFVNTASFSLCLSLCKSVLKKVKKSPEHSWLAEGGGPRGKASKPDGTTLTNETELDTF